MHSEALAKTEFQKTEIPRSLDGSPLAIPQLAPEPKDIDA